MIRQEVWAITVYVGMQSLHAIELSFNSMGLCRGWSLMISHWLFCHWNFPVVVHARV